MYTTFRMPSPSATPCSAYRLALSENRWLISYVYVLNICIG